MTSWEVTMGKMEHYQAQADFCVEMAGAIKRPDYREWWLSMAEEWRQLAEKPTRPIRKSEPTDHPQARHYGLHPVRLTVS
jgi:hypothetical protein